MQPTCRIIILKAILLLVTEILHGQVKITDGSNTVMDPNSILELESSNKGLLMPRVALNDLSLPAPLTAPVPAGMLVYSTGGSLEDGFYCWNGSGWINVTRNTGSNLRTISVSKDTILPKVSSFVIANNNITISLPAVTPADSGLQITIKNAGSPSDLVIVRGSGGSTMDNLDEIEVRPMLAKTFIAYGSVWLIQNRESDTDEIIDVGPDEPFTTLYDALDFLQAHMDKPSVIRLSGDVTEMDKTITINLPYPVTIEGVSFGANTIAAASGLTGKPMFRCVTECYFKMLAFDATTLTGYGTVEGEDAIRLAGNGTYHEIKDCTFDRFYNAVYDSTDAQLWLFECDISNCANSGLLLDSYSPGTDVRVSETDFVYCQTGVSLLRGTSARIQLMSGVYTNNPGYTAIAYNPATFSFTSLIITNNSWNYTGNGITGFDFSRTDGRDANCFIENNPGLLSNKPHCKINVVNNTSTTSCPSSNNWYKANWTNTSEIKTNISISGNRITYQPVNERDMTIIISGNVMVNSNNRVITIGLVRNGTTSTRYGETTLRITTSNQPFQFSTVIYINNVLHNDYFELYCSSANSGDVLTFQDIHWFTMTE